MTSKQGIEFEALRAKKFADFTQNSALAVTVYWGGACVVLLIITLAVAPTVNIILSAWGRLLAIAGCVAGNWALRQWPKSRWGERWPVVVFGLSNAPFAWMAPNLAGLGDIQQVTAIASMYFCQAALLTISLSARTRYTITGALLQIIIYYIAMRHYTGDYLKVYFVAALLMGGAAFIGHRLTMLARRRASVEARCELQLLPRGLLRATDSPARTAESCQRCVVLASDWRGYQAMTKDIPSQEIAALLARYYDLCSDILEHQARQVVVASDWIADELLVYFPVSNREEEAAAAAVAVAFARELLRRKNELAFSDGRSLALDIGVASGIAAFGLAGPPGRQKLVALGPALVAARTLQTRGKQLRQTRGEADRLIYDDRIGSLIGDDGDPGEPGKPRLDGWRFETPVPSAET